MKNQNLEWISEEKLRSHTKKHVIEGIEERDKWLPIYSNKKENLEKLITDKRNDIIEEIYKQESLDADCEATRMYAYYDDNTYSLNLIREKDNLIVGEKRNSNRQFKIYTCFFKKNIYIDTEILTAILKLEDSLTEECINEYLAINNFASYVCLNTDQWIQRKPIIYNAYKRIEKLDNETDDELFLRKKRYIAKEILKYFLHQQLKYHNDRGTDDSKYPKAEYEFFMNFLLDRDIPASVSQDIKEKSAKAIKEIQNILINLRKSGYSKEDADYHFVEITLIFYFVCFFHKLLFKTFYIINMILTCFSIANRYIALS